MTPDVTDQHLTRIKDVFIDQTLAAVRPHEKITDELLLKLGGFFREALQTVLVRFDSGIIPCAMLISPHSEAKETGNPPRCALAIAPGMLVETMAAKGLPKVLDSWRGMQILAESVQSACLFSRQYGNNTSVTIPDPGLNCPEEVNSARRTILRFVKAGDPALTMELAKFGQLADARGKMVNDRIYATELTRRRADSGDTFINTFTTFISMYGGAAIARSLMGLFRAFNLTKGTVLISEGVGGAAGYGLSGSLDRPDILRYADDYEDGYKTPSGMTYDLVYDKKDFAYELMYSVVALACLNFNSGAAYHNYSVFFNAAQKMQ